MHTIRPHSHAGTRGNHLSDNPKVPAHLQDVFEEYIRFLIDMPMMADRIYMRRVAMWNADTNKHAVQIKDLIDATAERQHILSQVVAEYLALGGIQSNPNQSTSDALIAMSGNLEIAQYGRQGARDFVVNLRTRATRPRP